MVARGMFRRENAGFLQQSVGEKLGAGFFGQELVRKRYGGT